MADEQAAQQRYCAELQQQINQQQALALALKAMVHKTTELEEQNQASRKLNEKLQKANDKLHGEKEAAE